MDKTIIKIIVVASVAALLAGCAILGSDAKGLYEIKQAHVRTFDKTAPECYSLTLAALDKWGAVAFQQRNNEYIVGMEFEKVFKSCINTTEAGIFFTQETPQRTEVRVTSLNYNLSQAIAGKLFSYIEKDGKEPPQEKKP